MFWDGTKKPQRKKGGGVDPWAALEDEEGSEGDDCSSGSMETDEFESLGESDAASSSEDAEGDAAGGAADDDNSIGSAGSGAETPSSTSGESVSALEASLLVDESAAAASATEGAASTSSSSDSSSSDGQESDEESDSDVSDAAPSTPPLPEGALVPIAPDGAPDIMPSKVQVNEHCHITYFHLGSRKDMIATCKKPGHGKCVRTRTCNPSDKKGKEGQGRCLGYLTAFCMHAMREDVADKKKHFEFKPTRAERQAARLNFTTFPGAHHFVAKERPKAEGEESEPEDEEV